MSVISSTINHGIVFDNVAYTSPLTITSGGLVNAGTSAAVNAAVYVTNASTLTLINYGRISAGGTLFGVYEAGSGLALANHGTIAASGNIAVVLNDAAVINALGGLISGSSGGVVANSGTITNAGTIDASGGSSFGIKLNGNGSINNAGHVTAGEYGLVLNGTDSVTNSGTVISGRRGLQAQGDVSLNNTGMMSGSQQGILLFAGGTISNTGQIVGQDGLGLGGGGVVTNSGTISGTYGAAVAMSTGGAITNNAAGLIKSVGTYQGVVLYGGTIANITNSGTIIGHTGLQFFYNGVYSAAATVTDTGTILGTGGTAIAFGTANDTLIIAGAAPRIQGVVNGGGGTNKLEFTSGASTGTLTGVNASFTNFSQGTVNAGATWALAGSDTFGATTTIVNSGALVDVGVLVNAGRLTAASTALSIASGGTLTNATTGTVTAGGIAVTASGTVS
ncbi:MAG: hypothetical protein J2P17_29100, partial [Mycobacterium sp.]|nr:hypothetical protein [Mycobacterium sp.]